MIDEVLERLIQLGILSANSQAAITASFGGTINIDIRGKNDEHFYVKISQKFDVLDEYQRISSLPNSLDRWICRPISLFKVAGQHALVLPGVAHRLIRREKVLNSKGPERRAILEFFSVSSAALVSQDRNRLKKELQRTQEELGIELDQKFLGKWQVKLDAEYLCDMSGVSQHGDFALNNLGWTRTGLHVFDWEEFSNTNIPGFDLTTFLISIVDFDPIRITGILEKTSDEAGRFARDACDAIGLHWSQYKALFPIHLVTLQVLRRRYCLAKVHVDRLVRGLRELA